MGMVGFVIVVVLVIAALVVLKTQQPAKGTDDLTFEMRTPLFTPAERSFYGVLEQAVGSGYRVFGKVRLGDVVKPGKGLNKSRRTTALNRLNQKHLDFVVCSAADLAVVGVVELDDQSHNREDRSNRDNFVDNALTGAQIPIARFSAKSGYALNDVRAKLTQAFRLTPAPASVAPLRTAPVHADSPPAPAAPAVVQPAEPAPPACPKCGAPMVKRQAKTGANAGNYFWACSTFPKCRQAMSIG